MTARTPQQLVLAMVLMAVAAAWKQLLRRDGKLFEAAAQKPGVKDSGG